jgi:asparagine synthase (glutamine-hydrolysing)
MCGHAGRISFNINDFEFNEQQKNQVFDALKYRGPDNKEYYNNYNSSFKLDLFHTRLSIIDLTNDGNQPFISNSNKSIIVFNGEIYNFKILRQELIEGGVSFRSKSDTEVIINGFEYWGIEKLIPKLDGMFSFYIFDFTTLHSYLVRDRYGKKPLYFNITNNQLSFSSDIRFFYSIPTIHFSLNIHSLGYYFYELSTPNKDSIWNEIKKLPESSYAIFSPNGSFSISEYDVTKYTNEIRHINKEKIVEHTEELLYKAVEKRMISDVPIATLLSGGIDSSLIVSQLYKINGPGINTFSIGFKDQKFNELPFAKYVADKFKTNHTELILDPRIDLPLDELIVEFGEPFADSSMIPSYLICKELSKSNKVVIGGDGGDELFAGYYQYYFAHKYSKIKKIKFVRPIIKTINKVKPTYRTNFLEKLLDHSKKEAYEFLYRNMSFNKSEIMKLIDNLQFVNSLEIESKKIWEEYSNTNDLLTQVISASLHTRLVNDYLVKLDRSSMFASVEMRSPFLDIELTRYVRKIDTSILMQPFGSKSILKCIAEKYFTKEFVHRPKKGFEIPISNWFKKELKDKWVEVVLEKKQNLIELDYKYIAEIFQQHITGTNHGHKIWVLYVFHVWAQSLPNTIRIKN